MTDELSALAFEVGAESERTSGLARGWGWVGLVAGKRGVQLLTLPRPAQKAALDAIWRHYPEVVIVPAVHPGALLATAAREVTGYLTGALREFSVPLDLRGNTPFALSVWAAAARIPHGETRTYRWVAEQVGEGQGVYQAVGAALGANPVPLIIPCHRVIGSDGGLHGYAGGLALKARLLAMEAGQVSLPL